MFNKTDRSFERAAIDPAERFAMLHRLKRRRTVAVWVIGFVFALFVFAPLILGSPALISLESLKWLDTLLRVLVGGFIGSLIGLTLIQQDIKMLILCHGATADPIGTENKPDLKNDEVPDQGNASPAP